ncbi:hypothetical protein BKA70DRAFT_1257887 [Coprinopsis sp. MPI-PUGE-AT-0042]|nr:hypothetical protein BKA70DRAFT_1257887 [Coprinopsis sp. MPI-PUGE-AT-0042]
MKIDWSSDYRPDGSARRPPPNTLHGWLAKMRGTLAGNEDLRTRGMREMRAARQYKEQQRERAKKARGNGILGLFVTKDEPKSSSGKSNPQRRLTREDRSMSYSSKKSVRSSSSRRPPPSRRGTTQSTRSTKSMPGSWPSDAPRSRPTPSRKSSRK